MTDDNPLLRLLEERYGQGYQSPALGGDDVYNTTDVMRGIRPNNMVTRPMRGLADLLRAFGRGPADIPTKGKLVPLLANAAGGGLDTAANWLEQRPEVGKDTIAPLGAAALAAPVSHALHGLHDARMARSLERRFPNESSAFADSPLPFSLGGRDIANVHWASDPLVAGSDAQAHAYARRAYAADRYITDGLERSRALPPGPERDAALAAWRSGRARLQRDHLSTVEMPDMPAANQAGAPQDRFRLLADNSRASLPGTIVNGLEQGAQRSRPAYTLSPPLVRPDEHSNGFYHHIHDSNTGRKIGSVSGTINDDTAFISWIGSSNQKNKLGPHGVRDLREAFRQYYPDVVRFEGDRSSGARKGPAATPDTPERQSVTLRSDAGSPLLPTASPQQDDYLADLFSQYGLEPPR